MLSSTSQPRQPFLSSTYSLSPLFLAIRVGYSKTTESICRILGIVVLCVSTVLVAVMVDTGSKDVGDY